MSAGAPQPAIDALRRDKHVIVIEEEAWFQNLHRTIHHAAMRKNFEVYLYDPLMQIFGTYAKTCSHEDYKVAVIPQGCFELRTDSSTRVTRTLSDALFAIHSNPTGDPGDPQYGKSRLGGWVEGKPWVQLPKKAKKKGAANTVKKVDAGKDNVEGQDNGSEVIAEEVSVDRKCSAEEGIDTGQKDITADEQGTNAEEEDAASDDEDAASDDEDVASDEEDITSDEEGTDVDEEDRDEQEFDTGEVPAMSVDGPSVEDASALVLDPKEVTQRLVKDLRQLCKQAYFAFDHFDDDEILSFITYGMTFSCFKFIRPANWDSIRGDKNGIVDAPIPIYSNERMVFDHWINPYLKKALRLMTASLDLTYQPSWFDPPTHDIPEPDLSIAQKAIDRYNKKIKGTVLGSSPERGPTKPVKGDSPYVDLTKEATAPAIQLRPKLRSGIGGAETSETDLESAENEGTETPEPAPEQHDGTDPTSSDIEDSPLAQHLPPQSAQSGHASRGNDAPATSGIPGTAGSSTEGTRNLADNARTSALALTSGVNLNDKLLTPKNRGKQIFKVPRGKARQKNIDFRTNANGSALPALLSPPINDAPTGDGLGGSGSHAFGHLPISQEANGDDSRTGVRSKAKSRKRKGRPSSPLRFDSPDPDPAGNSAPTLAGPSKKRRLVPQADEQPVDNSAGGPSSTSRMAAQVSAGATSARDDAAAERVYDPLTAPERARLPNTRVYQSRAAADRRARSKTKPAVGTAETAAAVAEPAAPGRSGIQARSIAGSSRARVRDSPPPQRKDKTKSKRSRK